MWSHAGGRASEFAATPHFQFSLHLSAFCSCCHDGQLIPWNHKSKGNNSDHNPPSSVTCSWLQHRGERFSAHAIVRMTVSLCFLLRVLPPLPIPISHRSALFSRVPQERKSSRIHRPRDNSSSRIGLMDGRMYQGLCIPVPVWQRFVYSVLSLSGLSARQHDP